MTDHQPAGRDAAYFDALYAADPDPWRFASSEYEAAKYRATLATLPARRWRCGFEAGCSIGVLTRMLADRCERLIAFDHARAAVDAARVRCADIASVEIEQASVPAQWPRSRLDLVVLSEVLYFLAPADVAGTAARIGETVDDDGVVVAVNWRGSTGTALSGDAATELLMGCLGSGWLADRPVSDPRYRIDLLRRRP